MYTPNMLVPPDQKSVPLNKGWQLSAFQSVAIRYRSPPIRKTRRNGSTTMESEGPRLDG